MRRTRTLLLFTSALLSLLLLFTIGCDEEDDPTGPDTDTAAANESIELANEALETLLMSWVNAGPSGPTDFDVSGPYALYLAALENDPNNAEANFGAGILELFMMMHLEEVVATFDDAFLFAGDVPLFKEAGSANHLFTPVTDMDQLAFTMTSPLTLTRALAAGDTATLTTIGEVQGYIRETLIDELEGVIARFDKVTANSDFVFIITPEMQGDPNEDPIELDLTEIYMTLAALNGLDGMLNAMVAYDFDLGQYQIEDISDALTPGSGFAALVADGADYTNGALAAWTSSLDNLQDGITYLMSESDDQSDDLIRIDPYDTDQQEVLQQFAEYAPKVRNLLTSSETFDLGDGQQLTVSLYNAYHDPVEDLKTLLPAYTIGDSAYRREAREIYDFTTCYDSVDVSSGGYLMILRSATYSDPETGWEIMIVAEDFTSDVADSIWQAALAEFSQYDSAEIALSAIVNAPEAGRYQASIYLETTYEVPADTVDVPVWTWDANDFSEWVFPDPTMSGLLPGMNDANLKQLMDLDGSLWTKENVFWFLAYLGPDLIMAPPQVDP